jgi:hypothetical protein
MSEYLDQLIKSLETEVKNARAMLENRDPMKRKPDPDAQHLRRLSQRLKSLKGIAVAAP